MGSLFFIVKSFILTSVLIFILQIEVGGEALEVKIYNQAKSGQFTQWLSQVGNGAIRITKSIYSQINKKRDINAMKEDAVEAVQGRMKNIDETISYLEGSRSIDDITDEIVDIARLQANKISEITGEQGGEYYESKTDEWSENDPLGYLTD